MSSLPAEAGVQAVPPPLPEQGHDYQPPVTSLPPITEPKERPATVSNTCSTVFDRFLLIKVVDDPRTYSRGFKWLVTILAAASAALDPMSSTIFYRKA